MSDHDPSADPSALDSWAGDSTLPDETVDDGFEPDSGTVVGRYTVLATVGRGASGVVVSAFDPQLDRKVALKFLHRAIVDDQDHDRLRQEAQALARLSHPNVIRVHDMGTYEGRVFMATELVDGVDLATWRQQRAPGWREVVRAMLEVGEGLAAAHDAGLVHRDFKPRNVLMGHDGRPRVTDFGQALGLDEARAAWTRHHFDDEATGGHSVEASLTQTGALVGTPAYMAPEQIEGAPPDPRADQWSFCVSLYELLWGQRPFDGRSLRELADRIRAGDVQAPPVRPRVPRGVRSVLRRGLCIDPSQRFDSMPALLAAMRRAVYWPRRAAWAVLPATVAAGIGVAAWPSAGADYCAQQERRLDVLWSPERQAAIGQAFESTHLVYAADSWARVRTPLDEVAERWRTAQRQACEAEAHGEAVDTRMICLHRRFSALERLVEVLEEADADVVEHAVEAARALHAEPACTDDHTEGPPPPTDPVARAQLEQLEALLARTDVAWSMGDREQALALAEQALAQAESPALRWPQAEAELLRAQAIDDDGDPKPAQEAFQRAFSAGLAAGHDVVVARSAVGVAGLSARGGDFEEAERWLELAEAATTRRGDRSGSLPVILESNRGRVDYHRGDFEGALGHFRRSVELAEAAGEADHPQQGSSLLNIGVALLNLARYDESIAALEDALANEQYHFGDSHPRVVRALNSLCDARNRAGQFDAAIDACNQGIAIIRDSGEHDSPRLVHLYTNLGVVLFGAGRPQEAETTYLQALELATKIYGDNDPMVGNLLNNLGVLYVDTGQLTKAQEYYGRALTLFDSVFGTKHPATGMLRTNLAMAYTKGEDFDRAEPLLRQSIEILEQTMGPDHVELALSLAELGRVHAGRKQHAEAITQLERAMALREAAGGEPLELADTKYSLADSLWVQGDGARARTLINEARTIYEKIDRKTRVDEMDAWLASHQG